MKRWARTDLWDANDDVYKSPGILKTGEINSYRIFMEILLEIGR